MINRREVTDWLPTSKKEVELRGWSELDVILFTGDAYIDHPSFGAAVVGRVLESQGLKVGIVPQPNWRDDLRDFKKLGKPKLFFGVAAGSMDSMVNHYTANRRLRSTDAYTPDNKSGQRPDRATIVYTNILKDLFPDVPVIIGGIEASLRRLTHYDYWDDKLMPSILIDSKADLMVHGMGDIAIKEIARYLQKGIPLSNLHNLYQTAYVVKEDAEVKPHKKWKTIALASHEDCLDDKIKYAKNFRYIETESNRTYAARITQTVKGETIVINPQYPNVSEEDVDATYDLPYTRLPHPRYNKRGQISAYEMIKFSVNSHRGCFGGCSFCTISAHQGKSIISRSEKSILKEVESITEHPEFKGYLSDVGGPSANMYKMKGIDMSICDMCSRPSCLHPKVCSNLDTSHQPMLDLYSKIRQNPKIKKAFVGSGIRYDLFLDNNGSLPKNDPSHKEYLETIVKHHVSGRLKVAPEHTSDNVLKIMRKPSFSLFHKMNKEFDRINKESSQQLQLIPYFISSHPGSSNEAMADLAVETKELGFNLEQVQDLTPTPMTVSTVIYYSGVHPYTLKPVYTPRNAKEKLGQRKFFFWHEKEQKKEIVRDLNNIGREDLVDRLFAPRVSKQNKVTEQGNFLPHNKRKKDPVKPDNKKSRSYKKKR